MLITNIKKAKKNLYSIYIDGEFFAKIDEETLSQHKIKKGLELNDDSLCYVLENSLKKQAKEKALFLLEFKDRSANELQKRLKKDFPEQIAQQTTQKMCELGFINDENYALKLSKDLFNLKKYAPRRIKMELLNKGISREIIDITLEKLEPIFENKTQTQLEEILEKRFKNWQQNPKIKQRAVSFLQRRGYNFSQINQVIKQTFDNF